MLRQMQVSWVWNALMKSKAAYESSIAKFPNRKIVNKLQKKTSIQLQSSHVVVVEHLSSALTQVVIRGCVL